jgi:hypothetical protein
MDSSKGKFRIQVDFNTGEEELMIRRSLFFQLESMMQEHRSMSAACQPTITSNMHLMEKGRGKTLSILEFKISINVVSILMPDHAFI